MTRHASCGKADGLGVEARTQLGSGPYSDLCGEVTKTGEFSTYSPYDNTTMPFWKTKQLRQGYWAATVSAATFGLGCDCCRDSDGRALLRTVLLRREFRDDPGWPGAARLRAEYRRPHLRRPRCTPSSRLGTDLALFLLHLACVAGYQLGDNDEWHKMTNFEHAT